MADDDMGNPYPPDPDDDEMDVHKPRSLRGRMQQHGGGAPIPAKTKGKQKGKLTSSKIMAKEKQRKALELRKGGATYDQIAQSLGYSDPSGARKSIERAMKKVIQEPALEVRTLQIERCNHMLLTLWPQVQSGDSGAINTALRVMQQLDGYMGTNMAQQVDVNVHHDAGVLVIDGNKDDFISQMKRMVGVDANGRNLPQLPDTPHTVPVGEGDEEIILDAEIEDDAEHDDGDDGDGNTSQDDGGSTGDGGPADAPAPAAPVFNFGMDPERFTP